MIPDIARQIIALTAHGTPHTATVTAWMHEHAAVVEDTDRDLARAMRAF